VGNAAWRIVLFTNTVNIDLMEVKCKEFGTFL